MTKSKRQTLRLLDGPIHSDRQIHPVVVVVNRQNLLAIESNVDKCHISLRKPKAVGLLVLAHKLCPLDPEGKLLGGMAFDPDNGIIVCINPYLAFEQIFVSA